MAIAVVVVMLIGAGGIAMTLAIVLATAMMRIH